MKRRVFVFFAVLFAAFNLLSQGIVFKCEAPKVVGLNERFRVNFTINASEVGNFVAPTFRNVNILGGPSTSRSSSVSIINGKRTDNSSTTFTFWLQSLTTGTITIPSARVKSNGKLYTTKPVTISVEDNPSMAKRSQNSGGANRRNNTAASPTVKVIDDKAVFVRAIPSKTKVFKGEEIVISYKIYTLVPISEYMVDKFPSSQGFWVEELDNQATPILEREIIDGKSYQVATLRKVLVYPQKSGTLHIQPMGLEVVAHLQTGTTQRQRVLTGDPFFDAFFNDPFFANVTPVFEKVNKKLKTNALTIEVEDLPPCKEDFSGGVGRFDVSCSMDTSYCKTNEAITLDFTISGQGNLSLIEAPKLEIPEQFEVYDPDISDKLSKTAAGQSGSRTFRYIIIPRVEGTYTIPALKFTYFDPEKREYKTLSTDDFRLNIKKGKNDGGFAKQMSEREKYRNMDITDITAGRVSKDVNSIKAFSSPVLYIILLLLLSGLVVAIYFTKQQIKQREDISGMKLKKANRVAVKRLKKAEMYLRNGQDEAFEKEIGQALWNYLSDKFRIATYDLNIENIQKALKESSLEETISENTLQTLSNCEYIRFSQNKQPSEYRKLYEQTVATITDIETNMTKSRKHSMAKAMPFILAAFVCMTSSLSAQNGSQADAAYKNKDYAKAMELYQKAEKDNPDAKLYHCIANTAFRMSDYTTAILYYEKALRFTPNDETLMTNYKICRSRLAGEVYVMPDFFLLRWVKALANLMSPLAWAILFCVLFACSCVGFFLYYFDVNRKVLLFYLCLLALVLSLGSFGLGLYRQNFIHNKDYAIVFSSDVSLKGNQASSSDNDTKLFKGQKVKIEKRTGEEVFVKTEDGKEGWISSSAIKVI